MDLRLKNMVAGTEIAEKQEVFRKYANIDTIQKLWVDMVKYYNEYHEISREHLRSILNFSKILFKWDNKDLEDILNKEYEERMEYKALFEGLECLYQKDFYKFKRILGELISGLGNLGEYALYSMSEGKIEDKNFTNDFGLYIEVVSDPYKQIQMETIFNLLFKDSDTLGFDYLDLEVKLLVMNDLYNGSLDFDEFYEDLNIGAREEISLYFPLFEEPLRIEITENTKFVQDSEGRFTILLIDNVQKRIPNALYRSYFIEQLKFGGIESIVCFDEFLNNELREEEYIQSLVGKTI
ncbi:hypothetical protein [Peptoniphilus harei]|uniref:Uncharacterized protein n=1 Tax=Peptoniphilus harei TaxID=54005 RepID=A0A943SPU2_9FIRM|nr:hypothetical protein [Peptoniphilus harei]MBS6535855.1 hypothetical protein [Peptoniphilus harei]